MEWPRSGEGSQRAFSLAWSLRGPCRELGDSNALSRRLEPLRRGWQRPAGPYWGIDFAAAGIMARKWSTRVDG
jgi:hypothetical protein